MDNVAHALFGVALARCGPAQRFGRGTTALLVVASNVPDVDALLLFRGDESAWLRRTATHSVAGAPLLALLLATACWLATRRRTPWRVLAGLSLLGVAGHVFLDLLNSYGVVALWPLSHERFELSWVFIIDLAFWALLLLPLLLRRPLASRLRETTLHRAALAALGAYVALCAAGRARAMSLLDRELARASIDASFRYAFPEPLGPHRWRVVAREGGTYHVWLAHVLDGTLDAQPDVATHDDDPLVVAARATARGQAIDRFAKAPAWTADARRGVASCTDLRFRSIVLGARRDGFRFEVKAPGP